MIKTKAIFCFMQNILLRQQVYRLKTIPQFIDLAKWFNYLLISAKYVTVAYVNLQTVLKQF